MGLKSWFGKKARPVASASGQEQKAPVPAATPSPNPQRADPPQAIQVTVSLEMNPCTAVAGTTTFAADAVAGLLSQRGITGERGYLEATAVLQRDPGNRVDPEAIDVLVDGFRVGCLPGYVAHNVRLKSGASLSAPYQLHTLQDGGKTKAKAFVWLDKAEPAWAHTQDAPPPLSARERTLDEAKSAAASVQEGLQAGGQRQRELERALVPWQGKKVHYLELAAPIKQLKREGRLDEALELSYVAIDSAEKDKGQGCPAPFYTMQAAIILRKLGRLDEEAAVLKRWLAATPKSQRSGTEAAERLAKIEAAKK